MTEDQRSLWSRIAAFDPDTADALPFSARLARENGWPRAYAARVLEEYRRFVFLCMAAGHPCTPSDAVDQAWHLHLIYTRSYWDDFCGRLLGRALHHGPTRGGPEEGAKFADWYTRTLGSYRAFFGEPPGDIWPPVSGRFGEESTGRRVITGRYWIIPKPAFLRGRRWLPAAWIPSALATAGCGVGADGPSSVLDWHGPEFLAFFWAGAVCAGLLSLAIRSWFRRRAKERLTRMEPPDDPYAIARLAGDQPRMLQTALTVLAVKGAIRPREGGSGVDATGVEPPELRDYEREVLGLIAARPDVDWATLRRELAGTLLPENHEEPVLPSAIGGRILMLLPPACLCALGVAKVFVGISRDRPVGFLLFSLCVVVLLMWQLFRSSRGIDARRVLLDEWRRRAEPLRSSVIRADGGMNAEDAARVAALYGAGFLTLGAYASVAPMIGALTPPAELTIGKEKSASVGCGGTTSSCGSDSGGGGGGGCGGGGCGGCGGGGD